MSVSASSVRLLIFAAFANCLGIAEQPAPAIKTSQPPLREWVFAGDGVTFDTRFPSSHVDECVALGQGEFSVVIRPENMPINNSAWFAFKVRATTPREIVVRLQIEGGSIRYRPKMSTDGLKWIALPDAAYEEVAEKKSAILKLEVGPEPLWIAAQEIVSSAQLEAWMRTLERLPHVTRADYGRSIRDHLLSKIEIGAGAKDYVVVVSRQHPPETTGSLALMTFVETIAGDSELARAFRQEFTVEVMPLLNPDGVDGGHWRHNLNGVDLNRDWGTFAQPETTATRDAILALRERGRIWLHLDFHSTMHDVFYTQPDEEPASPSGFTKEWLGAIQVRFPDYHVNRSSAREPKLTTSHNWAHRTLGIPAITYEIGDETDRVLLPRIAAGAAEEMMKRLLELKRAERSSQ